MAAASCCSSRCWRPGSLHLNWHGVWQAIAHATGNCTCSNAPLYVLFVLAFLTVCMCQCVDICCGAAAPMLCGCVLHCVLVSVNNVLSACLRVLHLACLSINTLDCWTPEFDAPKQMNADIQTIWQRHTGKHRPSRMIICPPLSPSSPRQSHPGTGQSAAAGRGKCSGGHKSIGECIPA